MPPKKAPKDIDEYKTKGRVGSYDPEEFEGKNYEAKKDVHNFRAIVFQAINSKDTTKSDLRKLKGFSSYLMSVDRAKGKRFMDKLTKFEKKKFKAAA